MAVRLVLWFLVGALGTSVVSYLAALLGAGEFFIAVQGRWHSYFFLGWAAWALLGGVVAVLLRVVIDQERAGQGKR